MSALRAACIDGPRQREPPRFGAYQSKKAQNAPFTALVGNPSRPEGEAWEFMRQGLPGATAAWTVSSNLTWGTVFTNMIFIFIWYWLLLLALVGTLHLLSVV